MVAMEVASDGDGTKFDMVEVESRSEEITYKTRLATTQTIYDRRCAGAFVRVTDAGHRDGNLKFATPLRKPAAVMVTYVVDLIAEIHPRPRFQPQFGSHAPTIFR